MPIEYLSGIQPGQKIDLGKFKDPVNFEWYRPELKRHLEFLSESVNKEYGQNFLSSDCRIIPSGPDAQLDSDWALEREREWSKKSGISLETWQKDKEKHLGTTAEMAITVALNKVIGRDFIIARACDYDDYRHGIDSVIIDKKSGKVICGFDEVLDNMGYGEAAKSEKVKKLIDKGGAEIKYGATIKDGELVRDSFKNVPSFYVSLSKLELSRLMESIRNKEDKSCEEAEKIFSKILNSLREQSLNLEVNRNLRKEAELAIFSLEKAFSNKE
jgi:hypothetical protein